MSTPHMGELSPLSTATRRRVLPSIRPAPALRRAAGTVSAEPQPESRTPVRSASFWQIVFAVWSSFFGVRKRRDHDAISQSIKPQHLIVAAVIGAALFVLTLIVIVR